MSSVSDDAIGFHRVLRAEIDAINARRAALGRTQRLPAKAASVDNSKTLDAVGLALSGGGVRSAAFSLGVLQALNQHNALRNVDYLSTVSGGGYIGAALSASMTATQGQFVFGNAPESGPAPPASEIGDTASVGHLRNYSNYLIPAGGRDVITGFAIVLRGIAANLALVLPVILLLAAATIMTNPERQALGCPDIFGIELCGPWIAVGNFRLTLIAALSSFAVFFAWALGRSFRSPDKLSEFRGIGPVIGASWLVLIAVVFFIELQSVVLLGMFDIGGRSFEFLSRAVKTLATIAAPIAAAVTFFRAQLGDILKAATTSTNWSTRAAALASKGAIWIAGSAVPLLIWVLYLYLSYWGIIDTGLSTVRLAAAEPQPGMFTTQQAIELRPQVFASKARDVPQYAGRESCQLPKSSEQADNDPAGAHTPRWLIRLATWVTYRAFCPAVGPLVSRSGLGTWFFGRMLERPIALLYVVTALALFALSWWLRPNANSLHRLYRDRLSKAFLFDPGTARAPEPDSDFPPLDRMRLSDLDTPHAPYHLINAALNIQGSKYANRRGRGADFFLMSPRFVGSKATGFARTWDFEQQAPAFDLATAMAISGAAASSNMGSKTIVPLRLTLTLLNVRLGYWLKNPGQIEPQGSRIARVARDRLKPRSTLFLFNEMTGRLYENSKDIYLTDGGHLENLGLYPLLRRRCKIIVVVDAEADIAMRFPSLIALQRHARIDLGVRIEMPWDQIQKTTCAHMGGVTGNPKEPPERRRGPHAAVGRIDYGGGQEGFLLYIKASLTGDENDYIRDYARRHEHFPHETTGDQFFSEEQFEVYRALGFHIVHRVLASGGASGTDSAAQNSAAKDQDPGNDVLQVFGCKDGSPLDAGHAAAKRVRAALLS